MSLLGAVAGSLSAAAGGGANTVTLPASQVTLASNQTQPDNMGVYVMIGTDGTIRTYEGTDNTPLWAQGTYHSDWCSSPSAGIGSSFQAKFTLNSGDTPSGAAGMTALTTTFQTISSDLSIGFNFSLNKASSQSCNIDITIEEIADSGNTDTGTFDLTGTT